MNYLSTFFIAVGLAMDAFAVSVSNGITIKKLKFSHAFKFGFFFGAFQFFMPIMGWFFASKFSEQIKAFDHWIAFILLFLIGFNMIIESFKTENNIYDNENILSLKNIIILSIATSIDALAVGISFAFFRINIYISSIIIGIVAFIFSFFGVIIGKKIGKYLNKNAERIGGIILITIGLKILLEHLFM